MLLELQRCFHAALADADAAPPQFRGRLATQGFAAYRNNFLVATRNTLATDFPVVERLVGAACFTALAREYRLAHPSLSGNLDDFGTHFPIFLGRRYRHTPYAYLGDVARLESALEHSLRGARRASLPLEALAALDPAQLAGVGLELQTSVRLLRSRWPVATVWAAHRHADEPPLIDLAAGPEWLLVERHDEGAQVRRIDARSHGFLTRLRRGMPLVRACQASFGDGAEDEAGAALARIFAWGCIAGLNFTHRSVISAGDTP